MQEPHIWTGLRRELAEYMTEHEISENDFRFLGIYEWQNVYDKVLKQFVDGKYAFECGLHWSNIENGFRKDINRIYDFAYQKSDAYKWLKRLPEIVKCEKVYIILEEDEWQNTKYWIAECSPAVIDFIVNDTYSVDDYYITDKKFNWLITENHHEVVHIIGEGLDADVIKSVCEA